MTALCDCMSWREQVSWYSNACIVAECYSEEKPFLCSQHSEKSHFCVPGTLKKSRLSSRHSENKPFLSSRHSENKPFLFSRHSEKKAISVFQATFEGWMEIMTDAVDSTFVSAITFFLSTCIATNKKTQSGTSVQLKDLCRTYHMVLWGDKGFNLKYVGAVVFSSKNTCIFSQTCFHGLTQDSNAS